MDVIKTNKQNETLFDELKNLEEKIREEIITNDQSEFAQENVESVFNIIEANMSFHCLFRQIIQLLKKVDVLHMNRSISGEDDNDERYFLHTYDEYFS